MLNCQLHCVIVKEINKMEEEGLLNSVEVHEEKPVLDSLLGKHLLIYLSIYQSSNSFCVFVKLCNVICVIFSHDEGHFLLMSTVLGKFEISLNIFSLCGCFFQLFKHSFKGNLVHI